MKIKSCLAFLLIYLALGCKNDPLQKVCIDPLGSQNISLKSGYWFCFGSTTDCFYNWCFRINSSAISNITYLPACTVGQLADVGVVSCLSEVKLNIGAPFAGSVVPALHHGYLIKFPDNTYGRFFIDSYEYESGTISKFNITRQYPF